MKRVNDLMPQIADMDNLREAFLVAARGKQACKEVVSFREALETNLLSIQQQLLDGSYRYGDYRLFTIFDPKKRIICAAPFRERVTFHAMMRVCHPLFENYQTCVSYASRLGLGSYKALEQARHYCHHYRWYLKMDVVKFFDSIHHGQMKRFLARMVKDRLLLAYWDMLIDGYETVPGRGLPIGNLTSQYFANHYMAVADHYAKEHLGIGPMIRYMDDVVIWSDNKDLLVCQAHEYEAFVNRQLKLQLHPFTMNKTIHGLSFLGYVVMPHELRLNRRSRHRYRTRIRKMEDMVEAGSLAQQQCLQNMQAMIAFTEKANSKRFLKTTDKEKK